MTSPRPRFFDTRAAYILFANVTTEKAVVAERVGREVDYLHPRPPGLRVFDAGMGDASVLTQVLRKMHTVFPHIPWTVVGKEISIEDVRQALVKLPDRFYEHPEMVFVVTNMRFREATRLCPDDASRLRWRDIPLVGSTAHEFASQIQDLLEVLADDWEVTTSAKTGNPMYVHPAVVVIYRADHEFILRSLIPDPDGPPPEYDLVIAAQPYRAAAPLESKVRNVVAPLAASLRPGGRLIGIHSTGRDPALEIIRQVWPDENPFIHGRRRSPTSSAARSTTPAWRWCLSEETTPSSASRCTTCRRRVPSTSGPRRCWRPGTPPPMSPRSTRSASARRCTAAPGKTPCAG